MCGSTDKETKVKKMLRSVISHLRALSLILFILLELYANCYVSVFLVNCSKFPVHAAALYARVVWPSLSGVGVFTGICSFTNLSPGILPLHSARYIFDLKLWGHQGLYIPHVLLMVHGSSYLEYFRAYCIVKWVLCWRST